MEEKKIEDAGPMFPIDTVTAGMSIRDYFAAHATLLPQDIEYANRHSGEAVLNIVAAIRYQYADAMIQARK